MSALEAWKANERFRLSGRRQDDLEEFGRTANPTGRINVPVSNPYTDTASDTEYDIAPGGGSLVMPGLPDWPMDTTFGYPFTDTTATYHPSTDAINAGSTDSQTDGDADPAGQPRYASATPADAPVGEPVTVIGNLVADPRLKELGTGAVVANFTIASTPRTWDQDTRQWQDGETVFLRASAWNATAQHAHASLTKGARVIAVGTIKSRTFQGKDGQPKTVEELVVEDVAVSLKFQGVIVERDQQRGRREDRAAG
ncbi:MULTISPECIES: single-stranded DNA-binding protein [Paenarthrobacter]|uniref:single-stranded DNA-binding protein n=1 Tax=Paenarthrobacter TaxID=1742992 RepID=UPI001FB23D4E|nr:MULTISPECIES: single-stranded DNA-binding protein [Paenarthrobacter]MCW3767801.1 single-stranded DNA-binding protein [Paenarthrobacter sp. PAE-2]UOD83389.1 single-stranded DNA-binding protein [Paenarthrobacter ureafaciens]WNZ05123.1 single-stranded DNA-binding protein [Paenarthrobacter ureafaciens]WOC63261.1 single-stranded DNA-binding protein [Paenarthrobacter sp. AT5]